MTSHDVLVAGESLVDLHPVDDDSSAGHETFQRRAGGAPANVAVALANLGAPPVFWTSIGDDAFGDHLRSVLTRASVPSQLVLQREDHPTGIALVDETAAAGFELYLDGTATVEFSITDIPETVFDEVAWVHLGGVLFGREPARTAMFELLDRARNHDCTISFDPNTRPSVWASTDEYVDVLDQVVDAVDVVVGHAADFPASAFPEGATVLAEALLDRGPSAVAITKGAAGAELRTRADSPWGACSCEHPGFDVTVVDTTGAGDAFTATLIRGLREDETSVAEALRLANASGAITTTRTGAIAALPDRESIDKWLQARDTEA